MIRKLAAVAADRTRTATANEPERWDVFSKDGEYFLRQTWDYCAAMDAAVVGYVVRPVMPF